jgi:hypothetical protein
MPFSIQAAAAGMIYTVFPFLPLTDQCIFLFCLIGGLIWRRLCVDCWFSFTPPDPGNRPAALAAAPVYTLDQFTLFS